MIHGLELPIQAQDLVKAYQTLPNINVFLRHLSLRNRWKISIWQ